MGAAARCLRGFLALCLALLPAQGLAGLGGADPQQEAPERLHSPDALRARLEEAGLRLDLAYTAEGLAVLRGGLETDEAREYRGLAEIGLALDLERVAGWRGARLVARAQDGRGSGISAEHVGDLQLLSNLEAHRLTQVSELFLEQAFLEAQVRLKLGKQDAAEDFAASELAAQFIHSSFGTIPNVPVPTYPDPALGAALLLEPEGPVRIGVGIYDGEPDGGRSGFASAFDGKGGAFSVLETSLGFHLGRERPGRFHAGIWYHSDELPDLDAGDSHRGNQGFYLLLDQWIYTEPRHDEGRGLGLFLQLGQAPGDRNEIETYAGGGVVVRGALPGRTADLLGLGVAHARLSDDLPTRAAGQAETVFELFYRAELPRGLTLQPDLQWVTNPGGDGRNAFVAGLRLEVGF
jgi:porin